MENKLKYDVVIIGGGTSGCACAYNCAQKKLKTLLIEKNNFLGGLMTGGLVIPIMKSSSNDLNTDFYQKLISKSKEYNSQITYEDGNDGWLNPEMLKIILDDVLSSSSIKPYLEILYETEVCNVELDDKMIKKIILSSNFLSIPIEAKYFVDSTGSAQFSKLCNCEFLDDTEVKQQNSLRFIVGNVNIDEFCNFIKLIDNDKDITNTYRNDIDTNNQLHFTTASTWDTNKIWALDKYLKKAVDNGDLEDSDRAYFQLFSVAGSNNQVAFNCPRINNYLDNPFLYSQELQNARKAIYRLYNFAKKYFPGFQNSIITNIASQTGIREQNRVKTKYIYQKDDIINANKFEKPVLTAQYPIDVHSDKQNQSILTKYSQYELPIESLMSADIDNLFVIGKIVGADFYSHSALRVQKSCMSMGEAVAKHIAN